MRWFAEAYAADPGHWRASPILGDQAAASYQRYLKSFEHEIPEFLKTSVKKDVSGTN